MRLSCFLGWQGVLKYVLFTKKRFKFLQKGFSGMFICTHGKLLWFGAMVNIGKQVVLVLDKNNVNQYLFYYDMKL